ncbi:MAG: 16S rRNA (guanine(527)-N(7))-methyltransferase RsmG [Chromatiales bacterium]|jgi:16S rRNA (guanine527-N7)-methyltransferase
MQDVADNPALSGRLIQGARILGLSLTESESKRLLRFIELLLKWNRAYNLTALRDPLEMIERHLLDSLSVLGYLQGSRILDIGTGPGLPGIPLAMLRPHWEFVLLDSNSKKIRFVRQVKLELALENIQPVHVRVEQYHPDRPFDTLIARAFTSLPRMLELTRGLWSAEACLLAMKGVVPQQELAALPTGIKFRSLPLQMPFSRVERHLIELKRVR